MHEVPRDDHYVLLPYHGQSTGEIVRTVCIHWALSKTVENFSVSIRISTLCLLILKYKFATSFRKAMMAGSLCLLGTKTLCIECAQHNVGVSQVT